MTLFRPMCLARPSPGGQGINQIPFTDFDEIGPGQFKSRKYGYTTTIYESTKVLLEHGSKDAIISAFSNYEIWLKLSVSVGATSLSKLDLPKGHSVHCVSLPAAVMGNVSEGEHLFPFVLKVQDDVLSIGTTAHPVVKHEDGQVSPGPMGRPMQFMVQVYTRDAENEPGWRSLF